MSALRFKVGEIALLHSTRTNQPLCPPQGTEVEVLIVGPFAPRTIHVLGGRRVGFADSGDYIVQTSDLYALCDDFELRKKRPPIPPEVLEQFNVAPVDAVPA